MIDVPVTGLPVRHSFGRLPAQADRPHRHRAGRRLPSTLPSGIYQRRSSTFVDSTMGVTHGAHTCMACFHAIAGVLSALLVRLSAATRVDIADIARQWCIRPCTPYKKDSSSPGACRRLARDATNNAQQGR